MGKKYKLTDETIVIEGHTLYRIKALRDFGSIKAGTIGGFIEKEDNLSQEGDCWVEGEACVFEAAHVNCNAYVYENAHVYGSAFISDNSCVYGSARVFCHAHVFDNACVSDNALVEGNAFLYGKARVFCRARISENAKILDNACIFGDAYVAKNARISGSTEISGNAKILGNACVLGDACISNNTYVTNNAYITSNRDVLFISSESKYRSGVTFYTSKDGNILVSFGCFDGTIDEFEKHIKETYEQEYVKEYELAMAMAKLHILK